MEQLVELLREGNYYFPNVSKEESSMKAEGLGENIIVFSTLIRIEKDNKWYVLLLSMMYAYKDNSEIIEYYEKFIKYAYMLKYRFKINEIDPLPTQFVDTLQISEKERVQTPRQ